jgi:hypothetical protein
VTLAKPKTNTLPRLGKSVGGVSERPTREDEESDLFSATRGCKDGERHPALQDGESLRGASTEWRARSVQRAGRGSSLVDGCTDDIGCPLDPQGGERTVRSRQQSTSTHHEMVMHLVKWGDDASFTWSRDPCLQIITQPFGGYPTRVMRSEEHRGRANP